MTDTAYVNAAVRRDALANEINKLQQRLDEARQEIARINRFMHDWAEFAGVANSLSPVDGEDTAEESENTTRSRPKNPSKETVIEWVREILREHGEPMSRNAIFKALQERDVKLEGSNPEMVLSTMLWRMRGSVVRLPKHGYWLADVSHGKSGYVALAETRPEYEKLVSDISSANKAYFQHDTPIVSDADYDAMRRRRAEMEVAFPDLKSTAFD